MHANQQPVSRRQMLATAAAGVGAVALRGVAAAAEPAPATAAVTSESLAAQLHASLTPAQREKVCFPWEIGRAHV